VSVDIACGGATCDAVASALQGVALSDGGSGGAGGEGGRGGAGGSGGGAERSNTHVDSSGQTVSDHTGCSGGSPRRAGSDGPKGSPGPDGRAGQVKVRMVGVAS